LYDPKHNNLIIYLIIMLVFIDSRIEKNNNITFYYFLYEKNYINVIYEYQ